MLRNDFREGFHYCNTLWEEYLGQIEGAPFIGVYEAYVAPMGTNIFSTWIGPADFVEAVNQIGLPLYAKQSHWTSTSTGNYTRSSTRCRSV